MKFHIYLVFILTTFASCTKEANNNPSSNPTNPTGDSSVLGFMQKKWIYDSILLYQDANIFGRYLYAFSPDPAQYADFRADGKIYSYGGSPTVHYDTSYFRVLSDSVRFIAVPIKNGVVSATADTGRILKLTRTGFMYTNRNAAGEHARWVLKR